MLRYVMFERALTFPRCFTANLTSSGTYLPPRVPQGKIYTCLPGNGGTWHWSVTNGVITVCTITFTLTEASIVFAGTAGSFCCFVDCILI